jgi:hypothetical protein
MRYALVGIGVNCCGVSVDEMLKRVGIRSLKDVEVTLQERLLADVAFRFETAAINESEDVDSSTAEENHSGNLRANAHGTSLQPDPHVDKPVK